MIRMYQSGIDSLSTDDKAKDDQAKKDSLHIPHETGLVIYEPVGSYDELRGTFALPMYGGKFAGESAKRVSDDQLPSGPFNGVYEVVTTTVDDGAIFAKGKLSITTMNLALAANKNGPRVPLWLSWAITPEPWAMSQIGFVPGTLFNYVGVGIEIGARDTEHSYLAAGWSNNLFRRTWTDNGQDFAQVGFGGPVVSVDEK